MELRLLKYFLAVAQEESITHAAEVLHITQPTLSRQIALLEDEVGVKLFKRSTRKIELTEEGIFLRRRAEEIIELVDKTEFELTERNIEGTISIGCGDLFSVQVMAELMGKFRARYPAVNFELYTATADIISERLERGLTDIGLLLEPVSIDKFSFIRLAKREEWVAVIPVADELAGKDSVTADDLASRPLILTQRPGVQSELANWFGERYKDINVFCISNLPSGSSVLVSCGLACSLIIKGSISFWDNAKVVYRPLSPKLESGCVVAWSRRHTFGIATEKFIDYLKEELRREHINA